MDYEGRMNRVFSLGVLFLLLSSPTVFSASDGDPLESGFKSPPVDARLRAYWWWLNGNVTTQAITRDLAEMSAKGMGGGLIFDADGSAQGGHVRVPAGPTFGSPAWRELFLHTLREANRLGLHMSLSPQSGWNLGGPPIGPEEATKHLVWSRLEVTGTGRQTIAPPEPKHDDPWYRDIAVVALPAQAAATTVHASSERKDHVAQLAMDGDAGTFWVSAGVEPGEGPRPDRPESLDLDLGADTVVSGIEVTGRPGYGPKEALWQVRHADGAWETLGQVSATETGSTRRMTVATTGRVFRLSITKAFDPRTPDAPRDVQVAELTLLDVAGKALTSRGTNPIRQFRLKAGYDEIGGSAPDGTPLLDDDPPSPGEQAARRAEVIALADKVPADGKITWDVPPGRWEILRFGYSPSGARVSTSSGEWQGRVVDYLNDRHLKFYWRQVIAPLLDAAGPLVGDTLTHLQTDSWELGGVNWTDDFAEQFWKFRGYDLRPFLPVLAGRLVENREVSNRFLADFRKTIGDLVSERHYAVLAALALDRGLAIHPESGGPHGAPLDALNCLRHSDMTMSEFWVPSPHRPKPENRFFVKQAASAAHVYGRRIVCAEGFTSIGPQWNDVLWRSQKPSFDHEACAGLNLVFWHAFTCSPPEMGLPGQEYFAGTHFNPQVTWWPMAGAFVAYLNRCQFLLQQGRPVSDVLHYYGDHVPNFARLKQDDPAKVLPGYDYDTIDERALLDRLTVESGRFVLPDGVSYRVLHLPARENISLPVLRKARDFVAAGGIVVGPKPARATGLAGWPACDREVQQLAEDLWGSGKITDRPAREALEAAKVLPDVEWLDAAPEAVFDWVHRLSGRADIYFVCNQRDRVERVNAAFRVTDRQPEIWDPVAGTLRNAAAFTPERKRTLVPLELPPHGSLFVIFRKPLFTQPPAGAVNWTEFTPVLNIDGAWQVAFDPAWGGPESIAFPTLIDWTRHEDPGVKNYSGRAVYRIHFQAPEAVKAGGKRFHIDLGDVSHLASVRLNGRDLGVVWTPPFRVDATSALRTGDNLLEIDVANSWFNRVRYEQYEKPATTLTKTNIRLKPKLPAESSGLFGPVTLLQAGP